MGAILKGLLAKGELVRVFALGQLCHPKMVEIVGLHGGFHAVWLDQEHAGLSIAQIESAALAARAAGIDSFVRLTATDYATVMRALEAGSGGIMAAMIRSVEEAERIVRWTKFSPRGERGVNGSGADGGFGSIPMLKYFEKANAETFVALQIEHIDAVNVVERIAAIPDVDTLFIGPADLSQSMGIPGQWEHADLWAAIERVASACKKHGTHWATLPMSPAFARRSVELGCSMLSLGLDVWAVHRGVDAFRQQYSDFFPATK